MSSPYHNFEVPFSASSQSSTGQLEGRLSAVTRSLNQPSTPLLQAFFAQANVDDIQNRLRGTIQRQTGYAIDRQSEQDLMIIMRKVYAEHANNKQTEVRAEVERLNGVVLSITVPMVASGVAGYIAYLRDASSLPEPLPRGQQTSVKGTKSFELFRAL